MRTRSSSNLPVESPPNPSTSNPKRRNRRRSKQPFILEESPVDTMADLRTMVELLRAPTEGYADAIVAPRFLLSNSSSSTAWDRYKDLLRACPHHGFTELHQLDIFYNSLNLADQDSLNSAAGGNLLERRTQDVLTIIENKFKVRNFQNKSVVSQVKSSDANSNSSSEIAKLTHAVNQQTSAVTTAMITILKQFQETPPPAFVKSVKEICVTCGGAHPYYQCLTADGNTFPKLRDNIQRYVAVAVVNYNQGNSGYRPPGSGSLPSNTIANQKGKLKAITTRSSIVLDGPFVPIPPSFINPEEYERVEETLTDQLLAEYTIKVPPPLVQKSKPPPQRNFVLHINITLADALIFITKYLKMLKALLSNKEKLLELANIPLNENCLAVILKKLPEKLGDPGKFLIMYGFSELKCKALADLGASINLMPLSIWKKLGLPKLISTRMTLEQANRAICTPSGIARDVFVPVGKFTFPADFVIADYESDPRVPLILGRPFLQTARALIDVHREEMILRDGDERLTLNMRHDTSSYSNQPQKESINMINICDNSIEDFLEKLVIANQQSGNPTFSSHPKLTSPKVKNDVFDPDQVLKPLFPSLIPVEDIGSFLEKSDTSLSLPENETFINHMEETNSGSTTTHVDYSLPKYDSFLFEIEPDQGKLTSIVMKDNLAESRVHVPNVLTTHPTLMLDSDFIPFDNSLPEYEIFYFDIEEKNSGSTTIHADISLLDLKCSNFYFKPDPGKLTSIVDFGICENVLFETNVNFPPEEDNSPLFTYVVWIFLSFLTYPVVPLNLLSFRNKDTIFDPGITNYHFPSLLPYVSHRCETFMKFNVYPKLLNESPMEILSFSCSLMEQ
uniref:Reverse transcriptase domain-containing protein n=1 Tax=Tanacetum cinerariifolium TaxID=118510 RepID=A0A6L2NYX3_TANCI|nr:reverse transcriptase domain-containing protein [Tanacetum cinerariifolium]